MKIEYRLAKIEKIVLDSKVWTVGPMTVSSLEELGAILDGKTNVNYNYVCRPVITIELERNKRITVERGLNSYIIGGWYSFVEDNRFESDFAGRWYANSKEEIVETIQTVLFEIS